jgi:hypothetical protein
MENIRKSLPGKYRYPIVYDPGALVYDEMCSQPYEDCMISAGLVTGHPVDTIYLRLSRLGDEEKTILLRTDEAMAVAWCVTGALFGERVQPMLEEQA